jgi:hypothetical protein
LLLGALLRIAATVAFRPALLYHADSYTYLHRARSLTPDPIRPVGYSLLLRLLDAPHHMWLVSVVQDVLGLLMGLALYLLLLRKAAPPWLAAAASLPALLDGYQVDIEQFVMTETFFEALVIAALVVLLWRARPSPRLAVLAGLLAGAAVTARLVGIMVCLVMLVALSVRRWPRPALAALLGIALPLAAYVGWYHHDRGQYAVQTVDGYSWYGLVTLFADCKGVAVPAVERPLCPDQPVTTRPSPNWYAWSPASPVHRVHPWPGHNVNTIAYEFSQRVIREDPTGYLRTVAGQFAHFFLPGHPVTRHSAQVATWQFAPSYAGLAAAQRSGARFDGFPSVRHIDRRLAGWLRAYQRYVYLPGPLLAALLLLALGGLVWGRGCRWETAVLFASALGMLLLPAATIIFDYRYALPAQPVAVAAAAMGGWSIALRRRAIPDHGGWPSTPTRSVGVSGSEAR